MKNKILYGILLFSLILISLISCDFLGGDNGGGDGGDPGIEGVYYCPDGEHSFDSWYTVEDATCTMAGSKTRSCTSCSYFEEEAIPAKGHNVYTKSVEDPTCYEDGVKIEGCKRSGCDYEKSTPIPSGHVFGDWYESKSPLCEEDGEEARECTREGCDHAEVRDGAAALDHLMGDWYETVAPTCESAGEETRKCTREGCDHSETRETPSFGGHSLGEWYEIKAPLCDKAGEERCDCQNDGCNYFDTRSIPPIGEHIMGDWYIAQNPSCIKDGLYVRDCGREGCIYYETEKIPAHGEHSYGLWYETVAPTCDSVGEKRRDCSTYGCTSFEVANIDMIPHTEVIHEGKAPTCTESGWAEYVTCEKCDYTTYEHLIAHHTFEGGICIACGERESSAYLVYTLSEDGTYYILTGFNNRNILDTELIVASIYNGLPVKEIRLTADIDNTTITSVTIPKTITYIDNMAFYFLKGVREVHIYDLVSWCKIQYFGLYSSPLYYGASLYLNGEMIEDLVIPEEVTKINSYAFCGASGIKSVTIKGGVTSVGLYAFYRCEELKEVKIGKSVNYIDEKAFYGCAFIESIYYDAEEMATDYPLFGSVESVLLTLTIGEDVRSIPDNAFKKLPATEVIFKEGCLSIGKSAFASSYNFLSITIPRSVVEISDDAFYQCLKLVEVYNLTSLTSDRGFFGADPYVIHTSEEAESRLFKIDGHIFYCEGGSYHVGRDVYYMGFVGRKTELTLPEDYKGVSYKFHPYSLINATVTELIVPNSFKELPEGVFHYLGSLEKITIPFVGKSNSASRHEGHFGYIFGYETSEDSENFRYHYYDKVTKLYYRYNIPKNLKTVVIAGEETVIHDNAFQNTSIYTITFGEKVKYIGKDVFSGCGALRQVNLLAVNMVSKYSNYTDIFGGAGNEQIGITLYVGNKVEKIESYLFYNVKNLTSIIFEKNSSLEYIGTCAFYGTRVSKVELPVGVSLGTSVFNSDVIITQ